MKYLLLVLSLFTFLTCSRPVEIAGGGNEEITGWVGRKDGLPVGECHITLRKIDEFSRTDTGTAGIYRKIVSDESAKFHFDRIISGKYSIEFNDNDTLGRLVTVTVTTGEPLAVTEYVEPYGALYGRIDSSVINKSAGLIVYAVEIKQGVKVDPSGNFGFNRLPPGSYSIKVGNAEAIISPLNDTLRITVDQNDTVFIINAGAAAGPRFVTFPDPPAAVMVQPAGNDVVRLTWNPDGNVSVFKIWRSDGDTLRFFPVDSTNVNAYSDSGLAPDAKYYYRLSSINIIGESPCTLIDSVLTYPPRPTGLQVKATAPGGVRLAWDSVSAGRNYLIYRKPGASGVFAVAGTTRSVMFTDTTIEPGTLYCYTIAASNASGESLRSDTVCAEAAGADSTFEKYFAAGAALEEIRAVVQQQDSGFLLCGKANISPEGLGNGWLIKLSSSGDEVWSYLFNDSGESELQTVISLPDGGSLACGRVGTGSDFSKYSGWVIRFDHNGATLWSKTYPMRSGGMFNAIAPALDGNYLLCGNGFQSDGSAGSPGWIVKIDNNGDTLRSKSFSDAGPTVAFNSIVQIPGGEIIICGVCRPDTAYIDKGLFYKADSAMNNFTRKEYSGGGINGGFKSVIRTDEPGFVFSGFTRVATDTAAGWVVKTDGDGNNLWSKTYPVKNPKAFCTGYDGSYLIGGAGVIMEIDGNGNEIRYKMVADKIAVSLLKTFDGGFIAGGYTSGTFKQGDRGDGWIIKFQENETP